MSSTATAQRPECPALLPPGFAGRWQGRCHPGHARCVRALKRWEALQRAAGTRPVTPQCRFRHKVAYENQAAVAAAWRSLPAWKRRAAKPYQCPAGHYHLGRDLRRAAAVWRK